MLFSGCVDLEVWNAEKNLQGILENLKDSAKSEKSEKSGNLENATAGVYFTMQTGHVTKANGPLTKSMGGACLRLMTEVCTTGGLIVTACSTARRQKRMIQGAF